MVPRRRRRIFYPGLGDIGQAGKETIPEEIVNAQLPDDEDGELEDNDGEGDRLASGRWIPDGDNQFTPHSRRSHKKSTYDE